jgi:hypothetical protein
MWELLYIALVLFLIVEVVWEKFDTSGINQKDYYPIN